jgi:hypothetical protein
VGLGPLVIKNLNPPVPAFFAVHVPLPPARLLISGL